MKRDALDGVPIARIARRYGVSRQSVYNVLNGPTEREGARKVSKLDPFKGYVEDRLQEFDLPATVLLREIKELGYSGGITILKEFVSSCKRDRVRQVIERFESDEEPHEPAKTSTIKPVLTAEPHGPYVGLGPGDSGALVNCCRSAGAGPRCNSCRGSILEARLDAPRRHLARLPVWRYLTSTRSSGHFSR